MTGPAAATGRRAEDAPRTGAGWRVRPAEAGDAPAVADAVARLLAELGAPPRPARDLEETAAAVVADEHSATLIAEEDEARGAGAIGLLAASFPLALHARGRYALIQDLWVAPDWRSRAVGAGLVAAFADVATARGATRIEVGLPRETFPALAATHRFYVANGFAPVGARLRRDLG